MDRPEELPHHGARVRYRGRLGSIVDIAEPGRFDSWWRVLFRPRGGDREGERWLQWGRALPNGGIEPGRHFEALQRVDKAGRAVTG